MKLSSPRFPLEELSSWPTWFQHTMIGLISTLLLFIFWHWNPVERKLMIATQENIALKKTIQSNAIPTSPPLSRSMNPSVQAIPLLQTLFKQNKLPLLLIKPIDNDRFNLHAKGHYNHLRQLINDLNCSTLTWNINSLTLMQTNLKPLDIQITLKTTHSAH